MLNNPSQMPKQGLGLINTLPLSPLHHQEWITLTCAHALFTICLQITKSELFGPTFAWTYAKNPFGTMWIWALNARSVWHWRSWMKEEGVHVLIMLIIHHLLGQNNLKQLKKGAMCGIRCVQGGLALQQNHL